MTDKTGPEGASMAEAEVKTDGEQPSVEIGLLLCDHLDDDIADVVGDYTDLFPATFGPSGLKLRIYEATRGELPGSTDECSGWMTSGSRYSAYDDEPWIAQLSDFIVDVASDRVPHAGICFGHQLIAQALGGHVARSTNGWGIGNKEFEVVSRAPWFEPAADRFRVLTSHQDQVLELPDGAEVLASAPYCPIGAYRIDDHVFAVQGHPEFTPQLNRMLIEKRRSKLGEDVATDALLSLDRDLDHHLLVRWIAKFLQLTS